MAERQLLGLCLEAPCNLHSERHEYSQPALVKSSKNWNLSITSRMDNYVAVAARAGTLESSEDDPVMAHTSTWVPFTNTTLSERSKS